MRVRVDQQADAIYLDLTGEKIESSEEVSEGIILDYDKEGNMVGIEILDASKKQGGLVFFGKSAWMSPLFLENCSLYSGNRLLGKFSLRNFNFMVK